MVTLTAQVSAREWPATYVWRRLRTLRVKRKGRHLRPGEAKRWTREHFHNLGLVRLRGTVAHPEQPFFKEAA